MNNKRIINKRVMANLLVVTGVICIAVATILAIANESENRSSHQQEIAVSTRLTDMVSENIKAKADENDDALSVNETVEYYEMPTCEIDGYKYIGYISFDTIDSVFPIMEEWDYSRLKKSPCRYSGSLKEHNLVIAGHNYRKGFGKLKNLRQGDKVYFTAMNGIVYEYEIEVTEVLKSSDINAMTVSPWDLSMYTCTYEGKQRFTVRCMEKNIYTKLVSE